jgi:lipoprotein NlpI
MLKLTDEEAERMQAFQLLEFPRLNNRKCNPQTFLNHLDRLLKQSQINTVEKARLLLEAGKLYLSLEWLPEAKEALRRSLELQGDQPRTLYYLGELAYREHNLFDARLYFSQLLQVCTADDFLLEDDNLHQLASHYLEILDRREYKRGSFKLVVNLQET